MHLKVKKDMWNCPPIPHKRQKHYHGNCTSRSVGLNDKKMVCASSLNAKRHRAKKAYRHDSSTGTDVITGLDELSTPDRKMNHSPYGKRERRKVIRRKKLRKGIFLKTKNQTKKTQTMRNPKTRKKIQCLPRDLQVLEHA